MRSGRQALHILLCTGLLLAAWSLLLLILPSRAQLAESNYQANLIRLQNFLFQPVRPAIFVGSSITGRLLPGYFDATALAKKSFEMFGPADALLLWIATKILVQRLTNYSATS